MDRYFDDYNPDLLPLIPPDARVILEVGCGTGRLCEAYRRMNPKVEWRGIEKNRTAATQAHDSGIEIVAEDAETCPIYDIGRLGEGSTNCLIFGDVLEHLHDPWATLKNLARLVKPGGQVLASIPNVGHYSLILSLLHGQWTYQDDGLLDRTHLRFFTLGSIKEMFAQAGLQVFEIRGRQIETNCEVEWFDVLNRLPEFPGLARQAMVYQYLIRAIRSEAPIQKLHIHAIGDGTICERTRLYEPMAMLSTIPGVKCMTASHALPIRDEPYDIVIIQRARNVNLNHYRDLIERGSLLIAEIDDDPAWLKGIPEIDFLPLRAVHAIQTTTEVMAETCREFNPHVAVFPNQIADLPPPRTYIDGGPIIFFGALNREADWAPIMPAINRVLADHDDVYFRVIHDKTFFDALETPLKLFDPFCQWDQYRKILRTCDIALLPLEDNRVNRHKSDLKFLECAAEGATVLMSTFAADQLQPIKTNDAYRCYFDPESFERNLKILIEHTRGRQRTAEIAYAYVRDHRLLSRHFRRRHEVYTHWLNRREELTRDLLERVPDLRSAPALAGSRPAPEVNPA